MKLLVVEHKLVDYQYFMDEMQQYEIFDLLELIPWANKTSYEQMRYMIWAVLKPYMKKQYTPEKIFPLYTDRHRSEVVEPEMTTEQMNELKEHILSLYKEKNMITQQHGK